MATDSNQNFIYRIRNKQNAERAGGLATNPWLFTRSYWCGCVLCVYRK